MKQKYGTKSSFHKLYLIDSEMYNRILPHLNEVDKQEVNALNENNRSFDEMNDEALDQGNDESQQDSVEVLPDEANKIETNIMTEKDSKTKTKKYACEICVDKKFTTKQSLKRHHRTFHEKKQSINEANIYPEITYPPVDSSIIKEPLSNKLKRKFEEDSDDLSKDQPAPKLAKHTYSDISRGTKRKDPVRASDSLGVIHI